MRQRRESSKQTDAKQQAMAEDAALHAQHAQLAAVAEPRVAKKSADCAKYSNEVQDCRCSLCRAHLEVLHKYNLAAEGLAMDVEPAKDT